MTTPEPFGQALPTARPFEGRAGELLPMEGLRASMGTEPRESQSADDGRLHQRLWPSWVVRKSI
jgi:hypothetical protein